MRRSWHFVLGVAASSVMGHHHHAFVCPLSRTTTTGYYHDYSAATTSRSRMPIHVVPVPPFGTRRPRCPMRSSSAMSSSYDPNDGESAEERRARMELVRKIQANFYRPDAADADDDTFAASTDNSDDGLGKSVDDDRSWLARDPHDASIMYNVPLWRVQWTELPGYQNVLNVHVPHYTHMFRKLLLERPKGPWYFGHVFLPGGSENLGNSEYFFPEREEHGTNAPSSSEEERERLAKVSHIGTLMQVTDYVEQEDGRLTLIVQGLRPMEILAASQQTPYAIARKVRILSDAECWEPCCSSLVGTAPTDVDLSTAYMDASKALAAEESEVFQDFEYYRTEAERHVTSDGAAMIAGVSPLSNVNGSAAVADFDMETRLKGAFSRCISRRAEECGRDDVLLAGAAFRWSDVRALRESANEEVAVLEREVWIKLDQTIRLLERAQPGMRIPVPTQLLGLLPTNADWPEGFRLRGYAERLENERAKIGTYSKSPFVRISESYPHYPAARRASRLSYTIWLLLDGIPVIGGGFNKEHYLRMDRVGDRLTKTMQHLDLINKAIEGMIG